MYIYKTQYIRESNVDDRSRSSFYFRYNKTFFFSLVLPGDALLATNSFRYVEQRYSLEEYKGSHFKREDM